MVRKRGRRGPRCLLKIKIKIKLDGPGELFDEGDVRLSRVKDDYWALGLE